MPDPKFRHTTEPLIIRHESGKLILPNQIASEIRNFEVTPEGTLISVHGPAPYVPQTGSTTEALSKAAFTYDGKVRGVFHALLERGSRDVLLIQEGDEIKSHMGLHTGSISSWKTIIGPSTTTAPQFAELSTTDQPQFPCQFEATPRGIVIVPQPYQRAYFYDGEMVLPLGYDQLPAPPTGYGPETRGTEDEAVGNDLGPNEAGYAIDRAGTGIANVEQDFGYGRLGTYMYGDNDSEGILLPGRWQAAVQWIDYFGNYSPQSERSNEITVDMQRVGKYPAANSVQYLGKHFAWGNIDTGPDGTLGRLFLRTRDLINSGTTKLYVVPSNVGATAGLSAFATIPDNYTQRFPDNIPDGWIVGEPLNCVTVPTFKLCRAAFGSLWIANMEDDPGLLMYSYPGKYGTFEVGSRMYPDPNGMEITGLCTAAEGLLVTTESSVFLITPSSDGLRFRSSTLSTNVGCVAPSSFGTMLDGSVIWLGREGFYRYDGQSLSLISDPIHTTIQKINWGWALGACAVVDPVSKEYRCWVPSDGNTINNLCLIWDGAGWRRRYGENLRSVCLTRDHRKYIVGVGEVIQKDSSSTTEGVWVLDHEVETFEPEEREHIIETAWISWTRSMDKKTVKTIYLALRETKDASAEVRVYRDWRKGATAIYKDTSSATLMLEEDSPKLWDRVKWEEEDAEYNVRRPYWKKLDIEIPACEVYKIIITTKSRLEFIGMTVDEEPKLGGFGSRIG